MESKYFIYKTIQRLPARRAYPEPAIIPAHICFLPSADGGGTVVVPFRWQHMLLCNRACLSSILSSIRLNTKFSSKLRSWRFPW
jgi:hypothetical protein